MRYTPRLILTPEKRARAVLLQARLYAASRELIDLVGGSDGDWPEWEDQNEAIRNDAHRLIESGAPLWEEP